MSLKTFHIFFIAVSIVITLGFPLWVWMRGGAEAPAGPAGPAGLGGLAAFSGFIGLGLIVYGIYFIRKSRSIIV